ncbi:ATP-dependent DNA helicase PIF1-like [Lineus longissimus]|uniref:ATP-dependent DNA helicase PIF1-like n=1 Tax=Lineus longissimus TaxID=88925 RepID=UPI00315D8805
MIQLLAQYTKELRAYHTKLSPKKPPPLRLFITGGAGTGKSHTITACTQYLLRSSPQSLQILTAPTGVAAYNINGITLHKALNLPVKHHKSANYQPLKGEKLADLRKLWKNIHYLIIDEISMVSIKTFTIIHQRLTEILATDNTDQLFAGISILAFGDFLKLKPVMGKYIFATPTPDTTIHLWKDVFTLLELQTNYRQASDQSYAQLLNRFRLGLHTTHDMQTLHERLLTPAALNQSPFHTAIRLYPTNKQCHQHNQAKISEQHHQHTLHATDSITNNCTPPKTLQELLPTDERDCAALIHPLVLAPGATVMLIRYLDTTVGLVNGATGTVTEIIPNTNINNSTVLITFHKQQIGNKYKTSTKHPNAIPIQPITATFYGKYNTTINITQFPLKLCCATTIHKMQGTSLDSAVLDLGPKMFTSGMAYVALSRVRNMSGLVITHIQKKSPGFAASKSALQEMKRLRQTTTLR